MGRDAQGLTALYVAAVTGLGYGLRQIVEASRAKGAQIEALVLSGGAGRHALVRQLLADTTGLPVEIPASPEPVLLGAAILGATAAGAYPGIGAAMATMTRHDCVVPPASGAIAALHAARFEAYQTLQQAETRARALIASARNGVTR
jgi:D-ribulokinase